ncbi:MAG: GFA family protein [Chromatiales bacterium]|nr:GFA family protein [Chromatiales bacterium]
MLDLPALGRCQCGACAYRIEAPPFVAYTCHCTECRKLTASAFLTCMQVPAEGVVVIGGTPVRRERTADSGNRLTTWFCAACGSTLYAENSARPRVRTVHVGTLERAEDVEVTAHIWLKRKLPWVEIPATHRQFAEAGDWTRDYARDPGRYRAS